MRLKHKLAKLIVLFGLIGATQGIAPAPNCSGCGTAAAFAEYMDAMQSQPRFFTQMWNYLLSAL